MDGKNQKVETANLSPEGAKRPSSVEPENIVPPQYAGLPSEVAEELWTEPIYVDEEQNRAVQERRTAGLAHIREREKAREVGKEQISTEQYALLTEDQKREFPLLQRQAAELVAEHIKGTTAIGTLSPEELFILNKAEDAWKESQKANPDASLTMTFGQEIDKNIYANLLNRLALEQSRLKRVEADQQQLSKVRKDLGVPTPIKPTATQPEVASPPKKEGVVTESKPIAKLTEVFNQRIAKTERPALKKALKALLEEIKTDGNRTKIAEVLLEDSRQEKRTADYPVNPEYNKAWEYALQHQEGMQSKIQNGWNYRGIFPSKSEGTKTETRGSLNINVTPDVVRELDSLIKRGVFKGNYKFGDPETGASALARHDAVTLYFLEQPSKEALDALSNIGKRNFRGDNLLGKKISEGFYMSEVGSVSDTHAKGLIEKLRAVDEKLGTAVKHFLSDSTGRIAMSEAQFYATKETLNLYGYDVAYDKEKGVTLVKN